MTHVRQLYFCVLGSLAVLLGASATSLAQPAGYTQRSGFTITETSGATLSNYAVRMVINTQALVSGGQMQADADDMIFTPSDCTYTILPHFIESGVNTASTVVWVRVPSLPAGGSTRITMWHGNPAATASSSAANTFINAGGGTPFSSTNQVSGGAAGGVGNSQRGFRFTVNAGADLLVVQFGKNEPTGTTRYVTLFNNATQAIVRQGQVSGAAAVYSYASVAPVWLTAGQQYILELFQGASDGYYILSGSSQVSADLTYGDMRYCNDCTQNTFPTTVLSNYHYGYPDFRYFKRVKAASEPTVAAAASACVPSASCDTDCTAASCGDGVLNTLAGEACDDGNASDTDACVGTCDDAACGDGFVHDGVEMCDDGNADEMDACLTSCTVASCGDAVVQTGVEDCDDGNDVDTDACLTTCLNASCGDGYVQAGVEDCDDGNDVDTDACANDCTPGGGGGVCGDGTVDSGEQCDDGNTTAGDGCSATCQDEGAGPVCGDGVLDDTEECDDGNANSDDGCGTGCTVENGYACDGEPSVCKIQGTCSCRGGLDASSGWLVLLVGLLALRRRRQTS